MMPPIYLPYPVSNRYARSKSALSKSATLEIQAATEPQDDLSKACKFVVHLPTPQLP
jgi:hypothetical protein